MIMWRNHLGASNDVWDLTDPTKNIDGGRCWGNDSVGGSSSSSSKIVLSPKSKMSSIRRGRECLLRSLSPHVMDLLAREDFSSIMAFQTDDFFFLPQQEQQQQYRPTSIDAHVTAVLQDSTTSNQMAAFPSEE